MLFDVRERGSALAAATGGDPVLGKEAILKLMEAVRVSISLVLF